MGKYFGTDGFRGEANVVLTVEHAFKVGRYLGWYYGRDHKAKIVIGKDTRRSSYMFEYALAAGLTASGADAYLLHVTTTPSVSYVVRTEDFDCGIMISASLNPFNDNGIKVLNENGQKISADIEARIEAYLDGEIEELPLATGEDIGCTDDFASGRNRYIGHLISIPCHDFKNIKVGLDCSNGSSSAIAKSVFDALRAKTYVINNEPNGTNINRDCGSTHNEGLQAFVKEKGLDENTIVFFSSDNGPHEEGGADPDFFGRDGKLRGLKRQCHEGGIRIPFIVRWPGHIASGTTNDHQLAFYDILPTFCELIGDKKFPGKNKDHFDGISFAPTLLGNDKKQKEHEFLYWEFHETDQMAVRMGDWKLIIKKGIPSLYNLKEDLHEDHDVASQNPSIVKKMLEVIQREHQPSDLFKVTLPTF